MVKWICSLALMLMLPQWASAEVSASLNQYIVPYGQSVQLSIEAKGGVDGEPDISPLRQDFDILGQSQSSQIRIINGDISRSKTWEYSLMPKQEGMVQVPPIQVGQAQTQALMLRVLDAQTKVGQVRDIWLEAEVSSDEVYVQAQVVLTVKLVRSVNLSQADLSEPDIQGAEVKQLGDDHNYEAVVEGRRVIISERQYAIFPQQSGSLEIPSVYFDGVISNSRSVFAQGRAVRLRSKPITVKVLDKPAIWDRHDIWLPAQSLELQELLPDGGVLEYRVGEPFTRTIVLKAQGLTSAQLPPLLEHQQIDGFKMYPDQPELSESMNHQGLVGTRIEKVAMIPTQAGTLHLPEIRVRWWNTEAQSIQNAIIAGRDIEVLPALQNHAANTPLAGQSPTPQKQAQTPQVSEGDKVLQHESEPQSAWWQWLALGFMGLWVATLILWWKGSRKTGERKQGESKFVFDVKGIEKQIKQACAQGDAKQVLALLPKWGAAFYQDDGIQYLAQMKGLSDKLDHEIMRLEQAVYAAKSAHDWSCDALLQALRELAKKANHKNDKVGLKPLYPEG